MSTQDLLEAKLYELNCANAEWHEATGKDLPAAQQKFMRALQWFKDRGITLSTSNDPTHRGVYTISQQSAS